MIPRTAAALLVAAALAGCSRGEGDAAVRNKAIRDAQIACLARSKDIFPQAYSWETQLEAMDRNDGSPMAGEFGGGDGFTWTFSTQETQRMLPVKVVCNGNTARRQIDAINYDGTIRRPPEGVVWSY